MYETADMMNSSKRRIVADLLAEARAGKIPETPKGHNLRGTFTGKPAPAAQKSAGRIDAKAISASFRDTIEKAEWDIIRNNRHLDQLENDIGTMQRMCVPEYSTLMMQKKKEREEVRGKIEKLQGIRDRCSKQLGLK